MARPERDLSASRGRHVLAFALALGCSVGVSIVDASVADRTIGALGLLASVPLVVASFGSVSDGVAAGVIAALALILMADYDHARWRGDVVAVLVGIAATTIVGVVVSLVRSHRLRRLQRVESVADVVQQTLLRPLPSRVDDVSIAAHYSSATRGAQVGGDVYEALSTPFGLRVFLGDVRGKGLPALTLANAVLGAFREWSFQTPEILDVAAHLDASVARNAGPEDFVTALIVGVGGDSVDLVNCGHPAPLLVSQSDVVAVAPQTTTVPLGLGASPMLQRIAFGPGRRLLLFTDGVSEARRKDKFFDIAGEVGDCHEADLQASVDRLRQRLVKFARRRLNDDIAIVMLEREAKVPDQIGHTSAYPDSQRDASETTRP